MNDRIFHKHKENWWKITHIAGRQTGQIVYQLSKEKINNANKWIEESSQSQMCECVNANCTFLSMKISRRKKKFPILSYFRRQHT